MLGDRFFGPHRDGTARQLSRQCLTHPLRLLEGKQLHHGWQVLNQLVEQIGRNLLISLMPQDRQCRKLLMPPLDET